MIIKKVVWNLFGGLNNSVLNALGEEEYKIFTFDILEEDKQGRQNIKLDLTSDNVIEELKKYPKPDIIVASPVCIAFSDMTAIKGGGNAYFRKDGSVRPFKELENTRFKNFDYIKNIRKLSLKSIENTIKIIEYFKPNYWYIKNIRKLSLKSIENTIKIIEYFKPNYWYIENPQTSLIWKHIEDNYSFFGYKNITHYGAYESDFKKPTIFLSNINLSLKKVSKDWRPKANIKGNFLMNFSNEKEREKAKNRKVVKAKNRSDIPILLIQDIFKQFETKQQKEENNE